jgi:hypothetical protein
MDKLILDVSEQIAGFAIRCGEDCGTIDFLSAPIEAYLGGDEQSASFMIRRDIRATVYQEEDGRIVLVATRDTIFPCSFAIKLNGFEIQESARDRLLLVLNNHEIIFKISDAYMEVDTYGAGKITMSGPAMEIAIHSSSLKTAANDMMRAMELDTLETYETLDYVPEFSIGVFDAYNPTTHAFTRPRPLRLGVPVISTLPTQGAELTQDEQDYLEAGIPPEERTMHFRIIASRLVETGLSEGDLSQLKLKLWLPSGLDTVALPIDVPMYYLGTDTDFGQTGPSATQAIYRASYTFHREDTIRYVDGFMYLSVFMPLTVQMGLPVVFRVSGTGSPGPQPDQAASAFAISAQSEGSPSEGQVEAAADLKITEKTKTKRKRR